MSRIQTLHRGPLRENQMNIGIGSIYQYFEILNITNIPDVVPESHTMYDSLDEYVSQKLPVADILKTVQFGGIIEVQGIYPKHFELVFDKEFERGELAEVHFYHRPTTRKYNVVRPRFFYNNIRKNLLSV